MPELDFRRHLVPSGGDAPERATFNRLSGSIRDIIPVADQNDRAALVNQMTAAGSPPSSSNPLYVFRADLPGLEWSTDGNTWRADGSWIDYTPAFTGFTLGTGGSMLGRYTRVGRLIRGNIRASLGTGATVTASITVNLPVPASTAPLWAISANQETPLGTAYGYSGGGTRYPGTALLVSTTQLIIGIQGGSNATARWGQNVPGAWAAGDRFQAEFSYEAAS